MSELGVNEKDYVGKPVHRDVVTGWVKQLKINNFNENWASGSKKML